MTKTESVSIVGGGIAGLAAGIALANQARATAIFECAKTFDPIGAGLQLGPNAVRALQKLGAWEAVAPTCFSPPAIQIWDGRNGRLLKTVRLGAPFEKRFGQPYRVTHRADLHSALLTVSKDHKNLKIRMGAEKSIADFSAEDTVIAADGIWSNMRQAMFPQAKVVALPDQIYRALVDIPKSSETDLANVNLWLFPGGHVVSYLVCGGKKLNIVAVTQGSTPKDHFAKAADHLQTIIAIPTEWLIWPGAYVEPMPQWHKDNVILIGDAAHGTLPYLAQGAAMALEDATALAQTGNDFSAFERLRRPRCLNLHGQSLHNGRIYHLNSYAAQLRNFALAAMPEQSFLSQLSWLYGP